MENGSGRVMFTQERSPGASTLPHGAGGGFDVWREARGANKRSGLQARTRNGGPLREARETHGEFRAVRCGFTGGEERENPFPRRLRRTWDQKARSVHRPGCGGKFLKIALIGFDIFPAECRSGSPILDIGQSDKGRLGSVACSHVIKTPKV